MELNACSRNCKKYKDNVFLAEVSGRKNVVFQNMANLIVSDKWYQWSNSEDEAQRIVETAAKII